MSPTTSAGPVAGVGPLLRTWRDRRGRSQLDLALDVGVSTRHLSFVETGRARPSAELLIALADGLDVPLRERNALLLAAGHAPRYAERPLDHPDMARARAAVQRVLDAHDPYPGVLLDRRWDVVDANAGALALLEGLPDHLRDPPMNAYRLSLHPEGLPARSGNVGEWAPHLLAQLERSVALTADQTVAALAEEVRAYPAVAALRGLPHPVDAPPVLAMHLRSAAGDLSLFTTLTSFGTPQDITLDELVVELFFPADDETAQRLGGLAKARAPGGRTAPTTPTRRT